jgi:hypothetical protein
MAKLSLETSFFALRENPVSKPRTPAGVFLGESLLPQAEVDTPAQ